MGSPKLMPCIVFYTHPGNIRQTCCFCGTARSHAFYCLLHTCRQYQMQYSSLHVLLARRPARRWRVCFHCSSQSASYPGDYNETFQLAAVGVIGQHATQRCPKLTYCFCAVAQIPACHCVLHALGQYETNELLLWDRPHAYSLS